MFGRKRPPRAVAACAECEFDPHDLTTSDAAVTLRTLARRFRAALAHPRADDDRSGDEPTDDDAADAPGDTEAPPDPTALGRVAGLTAALAARADALEAARREARPVVGSTPSTGPVGSVDGAITRLGEAAERLATAADGLSGSAWSRPAVLDGRDVTVRDVLDDAVHRAVHELRAVERR